MDDKEPKIPSDEAIAGDSGDTPADTGGAPDLNADNESGADGEDENIPEDIPQNVSDEEDEDEEAQRERERLRLKEKRKNKKRRKKTHGRLAFALIMVTVVISVAALVAVAAIGISSEILGLDRSGTEFSVEIPENSGTEAIANILYDEGIIGNPDLFRLVSKLKGADGTYMAGSHKLNPNMTYSDIIEVLREEPINPREFINITFPEGIRLIDAAAKLEEAGVCPADKFIRAFNSTSYGFDFEEHVTVSSKKFYKMEGYFFPDTYQFYLDEDPKNIVKKVFRNFESKITPNQYGRMEDIDMTLEEVLTLASIVQREASDPADMRLVASVFRNRLDNPDEFPLLQSDPTSNYAKEVIAPNLEVFSQTMCDSYDTYVGGGLPPGPICNPGMDAIDAVLYPRETDYFFFCSDLSTGEFFFAETLRGHEDNLVRAGLA